MGRWARGGRGRSSPESCRVEGTARGESAGWGSRRSPCLPLPPRARGPPAGPGACARAVAASLPPQAQDGGGRVRVGAVRQAGSAGLPPPPARLQPRIQVGRPRRHRPCSPPAASTAAPRPWRRGSEHAQSAAPPRPPPVAGRMRRSAEPSRAAQRPPASAAASVRPSSSGPSHHPLEGGGRARMTRGRAPWLQPGRANPRFPASAGQRSRPAPGRASHQHPEGAPSASRRSPAKRSFLSAPAAKGPDVSPLAPLQAPEPAAAADDLGLPVPLIGAVTFMLVVSRVDYAACDLGLPSRCSRLTAD